MDTPNNYSILLDKYALCEIRKHKWIQSEKCGQEIGFATAALDWIDKYGVTWRFYRFSKLFSAEKHMEHSEASIR